MHHQHEIRPWRHAPALLHTVFGHGTGLKAVQPFGALAVQRHFHNGRQPVALQRGQPVGLQQGHLALDQAFGVQALDAPQAGGRRHMHLLRQRLVALRGIALQQVEQLQVDGIDC